MSDLLALESYGLSSGFQGLKFVWCEVATKMKEMVKKGRDSGMI